MLEVDRVFSVCLRLRNRQIYECRVLFVVRFHSFRKRAKKTFQVCFVVAWEVLKRLTLCSTWSCSVLAFAISPSTAAISPSDNFCISPAGANAASTVSPFFSPFVSLDGSSSFLSSFGIVSFSLAYKRKNFFRWNKSMENGAETKNKNGKFLPQKQKYLFRFFSHVAFRLSFSLSSALSLSKFSPYFKSRHAIIPAEFHDLLF